MKKGTISVLHKYFFEKCKDDVLRAMQEFFDDKNITPGKPLVLNDPKEQELFMEWVIYDYELKNGKKVIDEYLDKNKSKLSEKERETYRALKQNKYGFYQIKKIKIGEWLELKDMENGQLHKVVEYQGTFNAEIGNVIIGRIGSVIDHEELIGCEGPYYPKEAAGELREILKNIDAPMSPKFTRYFYVIPKPISKNEIERGRKEIAVVFKSFLKDANSPFTFKQILDIIDCETGRKDFYKIVAVFNDTEISDPETIMELVTDAWNYFPHKSLDGKAPIEMVGKKY